MKLLFLQASMYPAFGVRCSTVFLFLIMLSKKSKYAINALVYLARKYQEDPKEKIQIAEISEKQNIPKKFLEAILLNLKNHGILGSKMGRGGGYYLRKEPAEVNLADIHRIFDGAIGLLPCVTYQYYEKCEECMDEDICGIREAIMEVRNQTVDILKSKTLRSIIEHEDRKKTRYQ